MHHLLLHQYTSQWLLLYYRDYYAVFLCHCWFSFIPWWGSWYPKWALLTRSQCRVSDTQVTVKTPGPLLICVNVFSLFRNYFPLEKCGPSFKQIRVLINQECFVASLVEICPGGFDKKIFISWNVFWRVCNYHSNKLESLSPKNAVCQVWAHPPKITQAYSSVEKFKTLIYGKYG